MKHIQSVLTVLIMCVAGCSDSGEESGFQEISLRCVDLVSSGGSLQVVISTEEEYQQLIYEQFTRPLQDYWNAYYPSVLQSVKNHNPGFTEQQCADSARRIMYLFPPFLGTENCSHPTIDFTKYTLLGQDSHASGCYRPDYLVAIFRDDRTRTISFTVNILQHGRCEMGFSRNTWVLVPKLPDGYEVKFYKNYSRDETGI